MASPIANKVASLRSKNFNLGNQITGEISADYSGTLQQFQNAHIYWHQVMGSEAHEVHGAIREKYLKLGGHHVHPTTKQRLFGFPLTDEGLTNDGRCRFSMFEFGIIYWLYGGVYVHGKIFEHYKTMNMVNSWLGYPIADPVSFSGGTLQYFEFGCLLHDPIAGNPIREIKWTTPQLGRPFMGTLKEFRKLNMIELSCSTMILSAFTAKVILGGAFKNKIFLKETGGTTEIPLMIAESTITADGPETSIGTHYRAGLTIVKQSDESLFKESTLYDIILKMPGNNTYTLAPHCFYLKNDWSKVNFAHITDIHIARRNDKFRKQLVALGLEGAAELLNNPNDRLREFIHYANLLHEQGKLDFIIATGDLVDYIFEDGGADFDHHYHDFNNFVYFEQILRGQALAEDQVSARELMVPIFTTLGNHDYRVKPYYLQFSTGELGLDIYSKSSYSTFNLIKAEANALTTVKSVGSDRALQMIRPDVENEGGNLNYYKKYINGVTSYEVRFGGSTIVMIDGKWDLDYLEGTWDALTTRVFGADTEDKATFVSGDPNSYGFYKGEIKLLKRALETTTGSVIVGVHDPVVNPRLNEYPHFWRESLRNMTPRAFNKEMRKHLVRMDPDQYLINRGSIPSLYKMDDDKHIGWSTRRSAYFATHNGDDMLDTGIMRGRKFDFLKLCAGVDVPKPVNIVLSGHVHKNWECKIKFNFGEDTFNFYSDFYTENPPEYYVQSEYKDGFYNDSDGLIAFSDDKKTKFRVFIDETAHIDESVHRNADGSFTLRTKPNPFALNLTDEKRMWWAVHSPVLLQTESLGCIHSRRGKGPHGPDFQGFRMISMDNDVIHNVKYIRKAEVQEAISKITVGTVFLGGFMPQG